MKTTIQTLAATLLTLVLSPLAGAGGGIGCILAFHKHQRETELSHGTGGVTGLMRAAASGNLAAAREALAAGDDVNGRTRPVTPDGAHVGGLTPLMFAAARPDPRMVTWLLEEGARVDEVSTNGQTALSRAVFAALMDENDASLKTIEILLQAGADPDLPRPKQIPLRQVAEMHGSPEVLRLLGAPRTSVAAQQTRENGSPARGQ